MGSGYCLCLSVVKCGFWPRFRHALCCLHSTTGCSSGIGAATCMCLCITRRYGADSM